MLYSGKNTNKIHRMILIVSMVDLVHDVGHDQWVVPAKKKSVKTQKPA